MILRMHLRRKNISKYYISSPKDMKEKISSRLYNDSEGKVVELVQDSICSLNASKQHKEAYFSPEEMKEILEKSYKNNIV